MRELQGRVAVVTGAASGIGLALAERFVREGMRVVMADVEAGRLEKAAARLREGGAEVADVVVDVADSASVEALADASYAAFGAVHVLCNNAGVLSGGRAWETPLEDWRWVLGVNLYGVIHGLQHFVPRMEAGGEEGHVVNVASMAAVTSMPFAGVYHVSKHGVLALSECLYKELALSQSKLRVSVLCPEMVNTRIGDSERNRPEPLRSETASPTRDMVVRATHEAAESGLAPSVMADRVVAALRDERFYILADDDTWLPLAETRSQDLLARRNPTLTLPTRGRA